MSETKQMQQPRGPESPTVARPHCREYHVASKNRAILEADRRAMSPAKNYTIERKNYIKNRDKHEAGCSGS